MIEVVRVGLLATIQDGGRIGWAHLGAPRSGALDLPSLVRANRLVGNPDDAAGIETTLRGLTLRVDAAATAVTIAVAGAPCEVSVDGVAIEFGVAMLVDAGATVVVGPASKGMRTYIAVGGGVDVAPVLGSRSTDSLSGLGPPPLKTGMALPIGSVRGDGAPPGDPTPIGSDVTVGLRFGPRDDWFASDTKDVMTSSAYQVTPLSNRVGARLAGPALTRANLAELPSEPIVLGAVQVLPDGQLVVFLADHPTTGGYPVIGVVDSDDVALFGQMRPGGTVRFKALA